MSSPPYWEKHQCLGSCSWCKEPLKCAKKRRHSSLPLEFMVAIALPIAINTKMGPWWKQENLPIVSPASSISICIKLSWKAIALTSPPAYLCTPQNPGKTRSGGLAQLRPPKDKNRFFTVSPMQANKKNQCCTQTK